MITLRRARRKLGSRSTRRRNTNGKGIPGTGGGSTRVMCYRNPRPAKRVCVKVHQYFRQVNNA